MAKKSYYSNGNIYIKKGYPLKDGSRDFGKRGEEIYALHLQGWSFSEIGHMYGTSRQAVHQCMRNYIKHNVNNSSTLINQSA